MTNSGWQTTRPWPLIGGYWTTKTADYVPFAASGGPVKMLSPCIKNCATMMTAQRYKKIISIRPRNRFYVALRQTLQYLIDNYFPRHNQTLRSRGLIHKANLRIWRKFWKFSRMKYTQFCYIKLQFLLLNAKPQL